MKVMIVVTHLLGTGHLSRALTLGRAFSGAGHEVLVVTGGMPAPQLGNTGVTLFGLPPLRSDGTDFTRLLTEAGPEADSAYLEARRQGLLAALERFLPDVLITELYPFGRRVLRREFLALLDAAHARPARPLVLCSIRDILAPPSTPEKAVAADQVIETYFDAVLVHSDPAAIRLEASWPVSEMTASKLRYTGYVAPAPAGPHAESLGKDEILVSAGGGSVGEPIFQAAIEAARMTPDRRWRLLVGGADAEERIDSLRQLASATPVLIERTRPDFRQMLHHCAASVSMCGYNTALDLLQAGTRAVLIPFDDGQEVEQGLRANALSRLPQFCVLRSAGLTGRSLADAVKAATERKLPRSPELHFDGAQQSVRIAEQMREALS